MVKWENYICACIDFFFFKQKTAYEMRISDWSSDVCSSDLVVMDRRRRQQRRNGDACRAYRAVAQADDVVTFMAGELGLLAEIRKRPLHPRRAVFRRIGDVELPAAERIVGSRVVVRQHSAVGARSTTALAEVPDQPDHP